MIITLLLIATVSFFIFFGIFFFMFFYLLKHKVVNYSSIYELFFWPAMAFRFRDYVQRNNRKLYYIYILFFVSVSTFALIISGLFLQGYKDMPIPMLAFGGIIIFFIAPIVIYIFVLMSKEKNY